MTKEDRINLYRELMGKGNNVIPVETLDEMGFFTAPASANHHGNYEGGLFDHSYAVTKELLNLTKKLGLTWSHSNSPHIVGMYHDLCKCDMYVKTDSRSIEPYKYNRHCKFTGHGDKSVILVKEHVNLTEEEELCILWHMGSFETDTSKWRGYTNAVKKYPNVLYTHTADMIASQVKDV